MPWVVSSPPTLESSMAGGGAATERAVDEEILGALSGEPFGTPTLDGHAACERRLHAKRIEVRMTTRIESE